MPWRSDDSISDFEEDLSEDSDEDGATSWDFSAEELLASCPSLARLPLRERERVLEKMRTHLPARGRGRTLQLRDMTPAEVEVERAMLKRRNRFSARACRQRKKSRVGDLETTVATLKQRAAKLDATVARLEAENARLRRRAGLPQLQTSRRPPSAGGEDSLLLEEDPDAPVVAPLALGHSQAPLSPLGASRAFSLLHSLPVVRTAGSPLAVDNHSLPSPTLALTTNWDLNLSLFVDPSTPTGGPPLSSSGGPPSNLLQEMLLALN
jgi:hypothetical protein